MAGPWEKYAAAPAAEAGPWAKYTPPAAPTVADIPGNAPGTMPAATARDVQNARQLAAVPVNNDNLLGRVAGSVEPLLTIGSGLVGSIAGPLAGLGSVISSGKFGTQEGAQVGKATSDRVAAGMTYQPRTDSGAAGMRAIATLAGPLEGLQGIASADALRMSAAAGSGVTALRGMAGPSAAAMAAQDAAQAAGAGKLSDLVRAPKPAMAGGGAAATAEELQRAQRFANMRAPMKPTKGILSRSIDDVQFEREAAKRPEGKALDARYAELNEGMGRHMDALIDETGAQASSNRATGKVITNAVGMKYGAKKAEKDAAYAQAEKAGEMAEMVDIAPLTNWVEKNRSAASTASIVNSIEKEIERLSGGTGKMSINDTEQLRKLASSLSEPGKPNGHYGNLAIKEIDQVTEGKGGPLYQQARRLNENLMKEFKDRDVVDKMMRTKRGTKDRAVAYEDVADHVLMDGSLDDMKHVFRVLEAHSKGTAPEIVAAGQQAAKELRGAAATRLKERMFSNAGADSRGNVVGSEAQIKRIVKELDDDGKLDYLFGKQGAQEIRDTVQVATDLYSMPKGTVNSSNTASAMEKVLDKLAGVGGGVPGVGHAIKYAAKKVESRNYKKKVDAALEPRNLSDLSGGK